MYQCTIEQSFLPAIWAVKGLPHGHLMKQLCTLVLSTRLCALQTWAHSSISSPNILSHVDQSQDSITTVHSIVPAWPLILYFETGLLTLSTNHSAWFWSFTHTQTIKINKDRQTESPIVEMAQPKGCAIWKIVILNKVVALLRVIYLSMLLVDTFSKILNFKTHDCCQKR